MSWRSPTLFWATRIWMFASRPHSTESGWLTCSKASARPSNVSGGSPARRIPESSSVRISTGRRMLMRTYRTPLVMFTAGALLSIAACAVITVNVYFPEKDVKSAYKSLEEELLQTPNKEQEPAPSQAPSSHLWNRQQLLAATRAWRIALVTEAMAQDDLSRRITEEIKGYPEVVAAYKGVGGRLARLNQLREQGLVGEANNGRVTFRAGPPQVSEADTALLGEENRDREGIIHGMARAILKLTRQEGTPANLARVKTEAAETFASIRREAAKSGWWVQRPDGAWTRK
ncbi:MAG: DUF1318 domain-containing protein [candidate division NC10 bacterium]|nr:DUF1318 domain-containing protein [candidate division NC10 bacterium]